ncbi:hypothetical protein C8R44DRAFT_753768 [Mycena epipterygia]|nr:hypothetical protein C8R44DRAFT_753768 [Mycena epipterygia]
MLSENSPALALTPKCMPGSRAVWDYNRETRRTKTRTCASPQGGRGVQVVHLRCTPNAIVDGRSLTNLANVLHERFQTRGDAGDLDSAIELHREALDLHPSPHPERGRSLNNVVTVLGKLFQTRGDAGDLDNAIELHREALDFYPAPDPVHLSNLANVVYQRFHTRGDAEDLDNAIVLQREALELCPAPHPHRGGDAGNLENAIELHREALDLHPAPHPGRGSSLHNLAVGLYKRFQTRGDPGDLDNAIMLQREALELCPASHPDRGSFLNNLASMLHERFQTRGDAEDLDNAIELQHEALELWAAHHPDRSSSLNNLATVLHERFQTRGDAGDLDNSIELDHEALDLSPAPHPNRGLCLNNLANRLHEQFQTRGDAGDLDNAIKLSHEAQVVFQPPHPSRGTALRNLATQLIYKYDNSADCNIMEDAIIGFRESSGYLPSPVSERCKTATSWARHADKNNHESALEAYETAVELLPQQGMLGLDIQSCQRALTLKSTIGLATNAAASASQLNEIRKAVEFLEAGRAVFWSQALQLHISLDDLETVHPNLAGRIQNLSKELEVGSHHAVASIRMLPAVHKDHMTLDKDDARYRKLNADWIQALDEVRQQPGSQRFLQPKLMDELKAAAINGPIVILNASKSSCTAFIVTLSRDVQPVNLENVTWDRAQLLVDLLCALLSQNSVHIVQTLTKIPETSEYHTPNEVFGRLLGELWTLIVQPVFHALELKTIAVDYGGVPQDPLLFFQSMLLGFTNPVKQTTASPFKMMAVIQPTTDNCSDLPATAEELARIKQQVPSQWLTSLGDTTSATVDVALQHLQESTVVSELMQGKSQKKSMTLAFLSACETAKGDDMVPDEAMHLAATLLFAGFRGVVATMWTMADPDGPKIAETFYQHLFKGCEANMDPPDLTKAAECLHIAVAKLRAENVPFSRWVPFVHYGL